MIHYKSITLIRNLESLFFSMHVASGNSNCNVVGCNSTNSGNSHTEFPEILNALYFSLSC